MQRSLLLPLMLGVVAAGEPAPVAPATPPVAAPVEITSAAWLKAQTKPAFRAGHTLPRLTRYGWSLPFETRVEVTENWGYALEYGGYVGDVKALDDPNSTESRLLALAKADPKRYPVAVICSRQLPGEEAPPETWTRDKDGKALNGQAKSMDGTTWSEAAGAIFSPEAPVSTWQMAGKFRADPLAELRKRGLPISIVLNGGEYGLAIIGFGKKLWELDPKVMAALQKDPFKGDWASYISERKGRAEKAIADAVRKAVPDRTLYVYYTAGGGTLRNKYWGQYEWDFSWKGMRGVSDLPSNEIYYKHFNSGFTGRENLLTLALNATAAEIAAGDTLSYNWICAGWPRGDEKVHCADLARWTGFLKCYYTAGMLGANVGFYDLPPGGFDANFPAAQPPIWLQQKVASSHVHALFSQYEDLIRNGDLLPGPMQHAISTSDPAYEFPTGDETARVVVRKLRKKTEWLVTAWAADGADRTVPITVPELGRIEVNARICGRRLSRDPGQGPGDPGPTRSRRRHLHQGRHRQTAGEAGRSGARQTASQGPAAVAVRRQRRDQGRRRQGLGVEEPGTDRHRLGPEQWRQSAAVVGEIDQRQAGAAPERRQPLAELAADARPGQGPQRSPDRLPGLHQHAGHRRQPRHLRSRRRRRPRRLARGQGLQDDRRHGWTEAGRDRRHELRRRAQRASPRAVGGQHARPRRHGPDRRPRRGADLPGRHVADRHDADHRIPARQVSAAPAKKP